MKRQEKPTTKQTDTRWHSAFGRWHYALTGAALACIVAGCLLMLPEKDVRNTVGGRYAAAPGPGAFAAQRIRWAPIPLFIGYAMIIPVILFVPPHRHPSHGAEGSETEK